MKKSEQKLLCLDGLKGIGACVIAFIWHYQHFSPRNGSPFGWLFPGFYQYGELMVEVFFMLSGFGMALGYERKIVDEQVSFSAFIVKRVRRLFPLLIMTLILTTFFQGIYLYKTGETFVYQGFDTYHFFLNLYGIQTGFLETGFSFNGPSWSISINIFLYIMFYSVVWAGKKYRENLAYMYVGIALIGCCFLRWNLNYPLLNGGIFRGISCFFIGAALYHIYIYQKEKAKNYVGYMSLIIVCFCYALARIFGYQSWGDVRMTVILAFGPFSLISILFVPWLEKVFSLKVLQWLGKKSFGIYLCHFPVQLLIKLIDTVLELHTDYSKHRVWGLYIIVTMVVVVFIEKGMEFAGKRIKVYVKE